jgi:hypothetical protein
MATEGVTIQYLLNLKKRLRERGSDCEALDTFFAEGADLMAREAEIERLKKMTTRIGLHLEEVELSESRAQHASQSADALGGIGKLFVKGFGSAMGEHAWVDAFEKNTAARQSGRQHCFGMIMVCVGKVGLPDDVHVVSVSERARVQNRSESEIIQELQQRGMLLFYPHVFLAMVDTLIEQLLDGKLRLPISPKQLPANLAIPRKVTVRFLTSVQWVPQLPAPKDTSTGDKTTSPNDTI